MNNFEVIRLLTMLSWKTKDAKLRVTFNSIKRRLDN